MSLCSRSFWLPCPPPFGGLRPGRARFCDRGALSFRPRLSLGLGVLWGFGVLRIPAFGLCRRGFSLSRFGTGWRFFGGLRVLRPRGGGYAVPLSGAIVWCHCLVIVDVLNGGARSPAGALLAYRCGRFIRWGAVRRRPPALRSSSLQHPATKTKQ